MTLRTKSGGISPGLLRVPSPYRGSRRAIGKYIFTLYERFTYMKITVVRSPRFLAPLLRRMFGL